MDKKTWNFAGGPARLFPEVYEEFEKNYKDPFGVGLSIFEIQHLKEGKDMYYETLDLIRKFCNIPKDYEMWFNDGSSGWNFSSIGYNLTSGPDAWINMLDTGYWSQNFGK